MWGLTYLNLAWNGVTDEALDAVLGYAKKDVMLRDVYIQGNEVEVRIVCFGLARFSLALSVSPLPPCL